MKKEIELKTIITLINTLINMIEEWKWEIIATNPEVQIYINKNMLPELKKIRNEFKTLK